MVNMDESPLDNGGEKVHEWVETISTAALKKIKLMNNCVDVHLAPVE